MVTFYCVQNIENLFNMIDRCAGPVYIMGSGGEKIDIRCNPLIKELMMNACQKSGIESLSVAVENAQDIPRIINYMMGCGC